MMASSNTHIALHGTNVVEAVERGPCVALGTSAEVSASELLCTEREREDDEGERRNERATRNFSSSLPRDEKR